MQNKIIKIRDPIHREIILQKEHTTYIDNSAFQRLRDIKQTSFLEFVYPCATHTRFSHCLGTYHLMSKFLENGLFEVDEKNKHNLLLASLFHDIGHGPFSHIWENIFPHFDHEKATKEILEKKFNLPEVSKIIAHKTPFSLLLSSTIDVDKLDYMIRDSYFSGVYGVGDIEFITSNSYISGDKFIVKEKAIINIEDLITKRVNLFKMLYLHKNSILRDFTLINTFKRVWNLYENEKEVFIDENLLTFFKKTNTIDNLLELSDSDIIYHLKKWTKNNDSILSKLAKMCLSKKSLNVINLTHKKLTEIEIENIKNQIIDLFGKESLDYYFGHYNRNLKVIENQIWVECRNEKIEKIEKLSSLIDFYKQNKIKVEFLFFPSEVKI